MKKLIESIYKQKNQFMIIGLTGKTGSGCTTISNILTKGYVDYSAVNCNDKPVQNRKDLIVKKFASEFFKDKNFTVIKPSTIIMMLFIFEKSIFFSQVKVLQDLLNTNQEEKHIKEECDKIFKLYKALTSFDINNKLDSSELFENHLMNLKSDFTDDNKEKLLTYIEDIKTKYEQELLGQDKTSLIDEINQLFTCDLNVADAMFQDYKYEQIEYESTDKTELYKKVKDKSYRKIKIVNAVLNYLAKNESELFIELYQKYNESIVTKRYTKELSIPQLQVIGDLVREKIDIFQLPDYVNLLIKAFRNQTKKQQNKACYIVIDSLKNPFEIVYFKERYSAYYTFSIHARDETIYERFSDIEEIKAIHQKEMNKDDTDKQKGSLDSKKDFNSQNIIECIQRSDIYIDNNNDKTDNLYKQVFKYLSLIVHPGLITPTKDEMIMQLALNAKYNSGCISRQVGAVVLNKYDSVRAVGWNDVPEGQTPCLLRSHNELLNNPSSLDYSSYEKNNLRKKNEFQYIFEKKVEEPKKQADKQYEISTSKGLNDSFCFKQVQNNIDGEKNQVYTRSLHAEENAFLQASKYGNTEIIGGQLFTTASPCFLCAKKAYQLGMKRIVYIEAYPDISKEQVFEIGRNDISIVHFRGAIGLAYQKLYEPIFSYKDELKAPNT